MGVQSVHFVRRYAWGERSRSDTSVIATPKSRGPRTNSSRIDVTLARGAATNQETAPSGDVGQLTEEARPLIWPGFLVMFTPYEG